MKRVKAACILQTLVFMQKEDCGLSQKSILEANRRDFEHYKQTMDRTHTRYQIVSAAEQEDGSLIVRWCKQTRTTQNPYKTVHPRLLQAGDFGDHSIFNWSYDVPQIGIVQLFHTFLCGVFKLFVSMEQFLPFFGQKASGARGAAFVAQDQRITQFIFCSVQ